MAESVHQQCEGEGRWSSYYLAVVREGNDVMHEVTKALYAGGTLRPDKYLKQTLSYTEEQYIEAFLLEQREVISSWPRATPYNIDKAASHPKWDILLHFRLQQRTCGLAPHNTWHFAKWNSLERLLFRLKELRNHVSHNVCKLTQKDLEIKISELENLYSQILRAAGHLKSSNFESNIKRILKRLSLRKIPSVTLSKGKTISDTNEKQSDPKEDCLKEVKCELLKKYKNKRMVSPGAVKLCKPVDISSLYSIPKLTISENNAKNDTRKMRADKLLKLMNSEQPEPILVIVGPSGSGKTALMLYIMDQWYSEFLVIEGLDTVDLLFYVDLESIPETSLAGLIKDNLLVESFSQVKLNRVVSKLQQWRTLWLLDGFGQCSLKSQALVREICTKFSTVVIAARPELTSNLKSSIKKAVILAELDVADVTSCRDICRRIVLHVCGKKSCEPIVEKIMNFFTCIGATERGLINSPLQVTRLCLLWLKNHAKQETIESCVQLYMGLLSFSLNKVVQRLVEKTGEIRVLLEQKILNLIDCVSLIAWELFYKNSVVLRKSQVTLLFDKCKELDLFEYRVIILSLFLDVKGFQENNVSFREPVFRFHERKDTEFFAARHIHTLLKTNEKFTLGKVIGNDKRWSEVVVNLVGIAALENTLSPSLAKQIVNYVQTLEYRLIDWIHLANQSMGNAHLVEEMSFIFKNSRSLLLDGSRLMDNWKTVLAIASQIHFQKVQLRFDSMPENMMATLKRVEMLVHRSCKIALLCNWSLNDYACEETVDDFLKMVSEIPCCLTEFSGHASSRAIFKWLPRTVRKLSLRLRTKEQANALQSWLKRHPLDELSLVIDFSITLLPNLLPVLTPSWIFNLDMLHTMPGIKVTVPRVDAERKEWVLRVLRRLYRGQYKLVLFEVNQLTSKEKTEEECEPIATEEFPTLSLAEVDRDGICETVMEEPKTGSSEFSEALGAWGFVRVLYVLLTRIFKEEESHMCMIAAETDYPFIFTMCLLWLLLLPLFDRTKQDCDKIARQFCDGILVHSDDAIIVRQGS